MRTIGLIAASWTIAALVMSLLLLIAWGVAGIFDLDYWNAATLLLYWMAGIAVANRMLEPYLNE